MQSFQEMKQNVDFEVSQAANPGDPEPLRVRAGPPEATIPRDKIAGNGEEDRVLQADPQATSNALHVGAIHEGNRLLSLQSRYQSRQLPPVATHHEPHHPPIEIRVPGLEIPGPWHWDQSRNQIEGEQTPEEDTSIRVDSKCIINKTFRLA